MAGDNGSAGTAQDDCVYSCESALAPTEGKVRTPKPATSLPGVMVRQWVPALIDEAPKSESPASWALTDPAAIAAMRFIRRNMALLPAAVARGADEASTVELNVNAVYSSTSAASRGVAPSPGSSCLSTVSTFTSLSPLRSRWSSSWMSSGSESAGSVLGVQSGAFTSEKLSAPAASAALKFIRRNVAHLPETASAAEETASPPVEAQSPTSAALRCLHGECSAPCLTSTATSPASSGRSCSSSSGSSLPSAPQSGAFTSEKLSAPAACAALKFIRRNVALLPETASAAEETASSPVEAQSPTSAALRCLNEGCSVPSLSSTPSSPASSGRSCSSSSGSSLPGTPQVPCNALSPARVSSGCFSGARYRFGSL